MPALWISHADVTDPDRYGKYGAIAVEVIAAHGGRFIARGGRYEQMEGRERPRQVVIHFPSMEDALKCYNSARYTEALEFARDSSDRDVVIVETSE